MGLSQLYAAMMASEQPMAIPRASYVGLQVTRSATSDVTDSAAAGTALATGTKTRNGSIGVDSLGHPLRSILQRAETAGLSTGLIATHSVTDATPRPRLSPIIPIGLRKRRSPKISSPPTWIFSSEEVANGSNIVPMAATYPTSYETKATIFSTP